MNTAKRKKNLIKKLRNREYREAFVSEQINVGIPFQIKTIREQRELTQKQLGENVHETMKQEQISRLEDPNYSKFTLATLKRLASAFEVGLIVRFAPISDLVEWELGLTSDSLKAVSFDQDDYFKERPEEISPIKFVSVATEVPKEDFLGTATVSFLTLPEAIPDNRKFVQANILGF
jgi:transcriptional regulator with XRE-family HTH domain